jgi:hypothetical protein
MQAFFLAPNLDQLVTTIEILQQQINVVKAHQVDRKVRTVMTHDSYYGTLAGIQLLRDQRIPAIWCLNSSRFSGLGAVIERFVTKTGSLSVKRTGQVICENF